MAICFDDQIVCSRVFIVSENPGACEIIIKTPKYRHRLSAKAVYNLSY